MFESSQKSNFEKYLYQNTLSKDKNRYQDYMLTDEEYLSPDKDSFSLLDNECLVSQNIKIQSKISCYPIQRLILSLDQANKA
jgi:hypothetical protein